MTAMMTPDYVTRGEFDIRQKNLEDKADYKEEIANAKFQSLERLLDERFAKLEAIIEKNTARQEGAIIELRGEDRAINARLDSLEKRIDDIQQTQSRWFTLLGILITVVPILVTLIQKFVN